MSLRWEQHIKQQSLADKLQITRRGLRKIEKSEVDVSARLLSKIVEELGEDMGEFWKKVEKNMEVMSNNIIIKLVVVLESRIASFLFLLEKSYGFML